MVRAKLLRSLSVVMTLVGLALCAATAQAQPLAPGGVAPQAGMPGVPQVPFLLAPQEEASLDLVLRAWQQHSSQIITYSCIFRLWQYDAKGFVNRPDFLVRQSEGEIKFAKPDKGLYHITKVIFPATDKGQEQEPGDYWVCDGRAIFTKDYKKRTVVEYRLPPDLQGKAISDGPLPFVFGVEAEKLKQRYWMRIITPADAKGQVWLEAYPKHHRDAQNFRKIDVILTDNDLTPTAVQIYLPNDESHRNPPLKVTNVYQFDKITKNAMLDRLNNFLTVFVGPPTPLGWKRDVQDGNQQGQVAGPPTGQAPGQPANGQLPKADRPMSLPPRR